MANKGTGYGAAASASLQQVAKALESYLAGRIDAQHLLGCMYTSAPGRRGFMQQAHSAFSTSSPSAAEETRTTTRPLASQLVSFAALISRALGPPSGEAPSESTQPLQPEEETVYAAVCAAEFWLQHVQQVLSLEAATAAGETENSMETAPVYREMEDLIPSLAAAARDRKVFFPAVAAAYLHLNVYGCPRRGDRPSCSLFINLSQCLLFVLLAAAAAHAEGSGRGVAADGRGGPVGVPGGGTGRGPRRAEGRRPPTGCCREEETDAAAGAAESPGGNPGGPWAGWGRGLYSHEGKKHALWAALGGALLQESYICLYFCCC